MALTARDQAAAFLARRRRLAHHAPATGLRATHAYLPTAGTSILAASFPDAVRALPITIALDIKKGAAYPDGVVFELGGDSAGIGCAILAARETFSFFAGDFDGGDEGVRCDAIIPVATFPTGRLLRFVFAVLPGIGIGALWLDGVLCVAAQAPSGRILQWTDDDNGAVRQQGGGSISSRASSSSSLTNASIASKVRFFVNQAPRQTPTSPKGNDQGGGTWESETR